MVIQMVNSSDIPRLESVDFFEKAIRQHNKVIDLKKVNEYYYSVELDDGGIIKYNLPIYILLVWQM